MSVNRDIDNYLAAKLRQERSGPVAVHTPGALPFITISRQSGAGGRALAAELLEVMAESDLEVFHDWQIFDQKMCETLLHDDRLASSMQSLLDEHYHNQIGEFVLGLFSHKPSQDAGLVRFSEAVRKVVHLGKVIMITNSAFQAAKGLGGGLHVRLVAPEEVRVQRMARMLDQSEDEVRETVHERDRERKRMLRNHFQVDGDNPLLYDALWNTARVPLRAIAEAIAAMVRVRHS